MPDKLTLPTANISELEKLSSDKVSKQAEISKSDAKRNLDIAKQNLYSKFEDLHGKEKTIENIAYYRDLKTRAKELMSYQHNLNDVGEIENYNMKWQANEIRKTKALGGDSAGERINEIKKYTALATENGLRIGKRKVEDKTREQIMNKINTFATEISKSDNLDKSKSAADDVVAMLNIAEMKGLLDKDEVDAYKNNVQSDIAQALFINVNDTNSFIAAKDGNEAALKDLKQKKEMLKDYYSLLSNKHKAMLIAKEKSYKSKLESDNLPEQQYELRGKLNNFGVGRSHARDVMRSINTAKTTAKRQLSKGDLTPQGRITAKKFLDQVNAAEKVVDYMGGLSAAVKKGTPLSPQILSIFDPSVSSGVVADQLGISKDGVGLDFFNLMRRDLITNVVVPRDKTMTNKNIYEFLGNISTGRPTLRKPTQSGDPIMDLKNEIQYEKMVNHSLGGDSNAMSQNSADAFSHLYKDPKNQEGLNAMAAEDPRFLSNIERHRSKEENLIIDQASVQALNHFSPDLGFTQGNLVGIKSAIANNNKAKSLYNKILSSITKGFYEGSGERMINAITKGTSFGRQEIAQILALAAFRDLVQRDGGAAPYDVISTQLGDLNAKNSNPLRRRLKRDTSDYMDKMQRGKRMRGKVATYGEGTLSQESNAANLVLGAFSAESGFGDVISQAFSGLDVGTRNIRRLDNAGMFQIESWVSGQVAKAFKTNVKGKLRLSHINGDLYGVGIEREDGSIQLLRNKNGQHIRFDQSLMNPEAKINKNKEASFVIDILKRSNGQ